MFKPAGTITGLYREDYGYNASAAAFNPYRDNWRDRRGNGAALSADNDDSYGARVTHKKKGVD